MDTFIGDTPTIQLLTGIDLSAYATKRVLYKKPDGSTGYWSAGINSADSTIMEITLGSSDLDTNGTWRLQAYVSQGNEQLHGRQVDINVLSPIL